MERRELFDLDAERYDRARPRYPEPLFDRLAAFAGLAPGARVLEIGCGTGQATAAMAERGWQVDALELGEALAARARANLAPYSNVTVRHASFDDASLPPGHYDAVVAFTSFHWLDPATRVRRTADVLRSGGTLATTATIHVQGADGFFVAAQPCYLRWDPDTTRSHVLPRPAEVRRDAAEVDATGRFEPAEFAEFPVDVTYSTEQYLDVLQTYSAVLGLPADARIGLLRCLEGLLEDEHGGRVTKSYLFQLRMARRLG